MENLKNHPLLERNIHCLTTYDEWLKKFKETINVEEILGLLHCGLDDYSTSNNIEFSDIVIIYFQYANGYNRHYCYPTFHYDKNSYSKFINDKTKISLLTLRQKISKKALSILCQRFLKNENIPFGSENPLWWILTIQESDNGVLDEIIRFFSHNRNLPVLKSNDNNIRILREFLYNLSILAWTCNDRLNNPLKIELAKIPECLIKYRKKFIYFLWHLDKLDFLVKNWRLLSQKDFETIKNLANNLENHTSKISISFEKALMQGNSMAICWNTLKRIREISEFKDFS